MELSEKKIKEFKETGFLIIRGLYSNEKLKKIIQWTNEVTNYPEIKNKYMMYFEESKLDSKKRILSRMENIEPFHKGFSKLFISGEIQKIVSQLFNEEALLFKDKINFKKPGGGGFRPHQDVQARWDQFVEYTMSVMISTDRSTSENGCLEVAPGHHKRGLIGNYDRPLEGDDLNGMKFEMVPTEVGDVLFFDHFTPHQSKSNMSDRPRSNIYLTYNLLSDGDHRNQYLEKKRREFPPDNERKDGVKIKNSAIHEAKYKAN